jgi:hypothetical protein
MKTVPTGVILVCGIVKKPSVIYKEGHGSFDSVVLVVLDFFHFKLNFNIELTYAGS